MSAFHLGHALLSRVIRSPTPAPPADAGLRPDLCRSFEEQRQAMIASRLAAGFLAFFAVLAAVDLSEGLGYPERRLALLQLTSAELVTAVLALLAARASRLRPSVIVLAAFSGLMALVSVYHALVHAGADRLNVALVVVMNAYAVVMVPTVVEQAVLSIVCVAGFVAVAPTLVFADGMAVPLIGVVAGGVASLMAATFMVRFSRTSYVHARLQQEEAEIASALLRVGEQLQARLERPRMLDEVNRLAVEVLGCDWSATYTFADEGRTLQLVASYGIPADRVDDSQMLNGADFIAIAHRAPTADGVFEVVDEEIVLTRADGGRRSIGAPAMLQALMIHDDEPIGLFGIGVERPGHRFGVRERCIARGIAHAAAIAIRNRRLLEDVQAASRLKSDFVATMSHELRTPINVIVGYVDMLADDAAGLSAEQQALAASIRASAVELLELVNSTLALNRLEAGRDPVEAMLFPLDALFADIGREARALVPAQVSLTLTCDAAVRDVATDRPKLKTVVKNLVGNALKFTARGVVAVDATADGDALVVRVADTGIGMSPDELPVIFEMFRQGRGASPHGSGGVGLGLHIVKRLVGLLGGTVDVESARGTGTTFTVRLPGVVVLVPAAAAAGC